MTDKINISNIVKDHLETLKDFDSQKASHLDYIVFFCIPFGLSLFLVFLGIVVDDKVTNVVVTSMSIFAALLFNLLLLIYDIVKKDKVNGGKKDSLRNKYLNEVFSNISFCVLISLFAVFLCIMFYFICNKIAIMILSFVVYFLLLCFLLTLIMILKRVHNLLFVEFNS